MKNCQMLLKTTRDVKHTMKIKDVDRVAEDEVGSAEGNKADVLKVRFIYILVYIHVCTC
jgi:hypothetical protein